MSFLVTLAMEDILELHRRQLAKWGGAQGIHDRNAIEAACNAPNNVFCYEGGDVVDCAAALMWHLCANHGFRDGNKRVGAVAGIVMLSVNGVGLPGDAEFQSELIQLMMATAEGKTTRQEVARFLRQRARLSSFSSGGARVERGKAGSEQGKRIRWKEAIQESGELPEGHLEKPFTERAVEAEAWSEEMKDAPAGRRILRRGGPVKASRKKPKT